MWRTQKHYANGELYFSKQQANKNQYIEIVLANGEPLKCFKKAVRVDLDFRKRVDRG